MNENEKKYLSLDVTAGHALCEIPLPKPRPEPIMPDSVHTLGEIIRWVVANPVWVVELDEATYDQWLNRLPPHIVDTGDNLCTDLADLYRVLFTDRRRFFIRRLNWVQTYQIYKAASIPLPGNK